MNITRRQFVLGTGGALAASALPLKAQDYPQIQPLRGNQFDLNIGYQALNITGKPALATTVNGGLPGPTLRWKEGERVSIRVTNHLDIPSSIHWHGIILPSTMDGSPGFDFAGIQPGETFEYQFDVQQSGTYWYHSHSGFQEQTGLLGAIIIDPKEPDPIAYDRELLVLLSDWTDREPAQLYARLKKSSHYYNFRERTLGILVEDLKTKGWRQTRADRAMWNQMRMSESDLADVGAQEYTYLVNGATPAQNWLGLCKPGERVRLRIINGAAMTLFDLRIPGLKMTVVAADGQPVQPIEVDEFRIGNAEVYDVIVTPEADRAYCLFAQNIDRTGFACATLTTNPGLRAPVPALDPPELLGHRDMGMGGGHEAHGQTAIHDHTTSTQAAAVHDHSATDHAGMDHAAVDHSTMDHSTMDHSTMDHSTMDHSATSTPSAAGDHSQHQTQTGFAKAGFGSNFDASGSPIQHSASELGPGVDNRAQMPASGLADPGLGLRNHQQRYGRRVLAYADLRSLHPTRDTREPGREIELHLTGNMERYIWSINGQRFADAAPLELTYGERVRIILINDTMMTHPIHLHGMWSELETGDPDHIPRKHTVLVQPGSKISYLVTADAPGNWAYHCHLLFHMLGMMRQVSVTKDKATQGEHHHVH